MKPLHGKITKTPHKTCQKSEKDSAIALPRFVKGMYYPEGRGKILSGLDIH
jgi:hypothetical protein